MGIVGGKLLLLVLALFIGIGMALAGGYVTLHQDGYACLSGRKWLSDVPKQRLFAVGELNVMYQPLNFSCNEDNRYDPSIYRSVGGGRLEVK